MAESVITITLIGLAAWQILMSLYFYYYKEVVIEAALTLLCALTTIGLCLFGYFVYFPRWNAIISFAGVDQIDPNIFRDHYLHPCLKDQKVLKKNAQRQYNTFEDIATSPYLGSPDKDEREGGYGAVAKVKKHTHLSSPDYSSYDEKYDASD